MILKHMTSVNDFMDDKLRERYTEKAETDKLTGSGGDYEIVTWTHALF